MYVDMHCGRCESSLSLDSDEENAGWLMAHRFANAHAECGYMTATTGDESDSAVKKTIRPRLTGDSEEA